MPGHTARSKRPCGQRESTPTPRCSSWATPRVGWSHPPSPHPATSTLKACTRWAASSAKAWFPKAFPGSQSSTPTTWSRLSAATGVPPTPCWCGVKCSQIRRCRATPCFRRTSSHATGRRQRCSTPLVTRDPLKCWNDSTHSVATPKLSPRRGISPGGERIEPLAEVVEAPFDELRERLAARVGAEHRTQHDADQPAQQRQHQGTEHAPPEAVDVEPEADQVGDPGHQQEQQRVDHQGDEAEGQDVDGEGDDADEVTDHPVDDPEDAGDQQERQHLRQGVVRLIGHNTDAGDQHGGDPQGERVDQQAYYETCHSPTIAVRWDAGQLLPSLKVKG